MIWVSHNFGTGTRSLPKRVFVQCVRVQNLWDTDLHIAQTLVFMMVSVAKKFGTRNYGPVPHVFLRITRVLRLWLTTFEHDSFEQNDAFQDAAVAGILPAFGRQWDKYHGAPIVAMRTLTVLSIGTILKVSRLSGQ